MTYSATYSPDDNKLRLYASARLDGLTYEKARALGFRWAPRQELFVAPAWTPAREDFLLELAGEIDDEDKSLVERAEERAERFSDYHEARAADAERARAAVAAIADNIPLGQPILVGHHSEKHARRDQARIENGMRRAVKMWDTAKYWTDRAAGALRHAKYKELSGVRHRRIKGLEADCRKAQRQLAETKAGQAKWLKPIPDVAANLAAGYNFELERSHRAGEIGDRQVIAMKRATYERAVADGERWIAHYGNRLAYERAMLAQQIGTGAGENPLGGRFDLATGGRVKIGSEWLTILRVNKAEGGTPVSVTTTAPAAVTWTNKWKHGIERVQDYEAPSTERAAAVKRAMALPPLCNYPGPGIREMTEAEWKARRKWSDFPYVGTIAPSATAGAHRRRQMPVPEKMWERQPVFITDGRRVDPPALSSAPAANPAGQLTISAPAVLARAGAQARAAALDPRELQFKAMRDQLKAGVQVVVAPQLFATPADVADRMVALAAIEPGMSVLEPEAGTGNLIWAVARAHSVLECPLTAVEINGQLADGLQRAFPDVAVTHGDFLDTERGPKFDRVLMNPPFHNGADIDHIIHAFHMLKPGGKLVGLCANGPRQQAMLKPIADGWKELPAGTFKQAGTNVNTALVILQAP
jgi:phospholipid N-methyltransferase